MNESYVMSRFWAITAAVVSAAEALFYCCDSTNR